MTISMYTASVPSFIHALKNLIDIIEKGAAHAAEKSIDPSVFTSSRLYPDMLPFSRQIQIATDIVKGGAARLAGVEPPPYADTETTFPELIARVNKTIDYLKTFTADQIDGSEGREITIKMRSGPVSFTGLEYLQTFVIPNLYFHSTTAYGLLRHNGVVLGKLDFLGKR